MDGWTDGWRCDAHSVWDAAFRRAERCVVFLEQLSLEGLFAEIILCTREGSWGISLHKFEVSWRPSAGLNRAVSCGGCQGWQGQGKVVLYLSTAVVCWVFGRFEEENTVLVIFKRKMPPF